MIAEDFRRILTAFADTPADVDFAKGTLLVQVNDELIEAHVGVNEGSLVVTENGDTQPAARWLIRRVARLPLLADRIIHNIPEEQTFVSPDGDFLDQIDEAPNDTDQYVSDVPDTLQSVIGRRPAGAASVIYLTSDAGEGKTTLISHLARHQAQRYKDKLADWILVPVSLGGRTFMRFDDVIVGALMNRFRFNMLFYNAFIELVRLGAVVPALDGFEEMFVEGSSGNAMSALGNLMQAMQSSGTVLIAARKAYFEYKNLKTQTRLFDSLGGQSVTFSRLALRRWNKERFLSYAEKRGITDGDVIYTDVSTHLRPDHPLLCRAVLVRRLLDIATDVADRKALLHKITCDPADYFRQFIGSIIQREAHEKWIDKVGEPAQPLISEVEHYELLAALAFEMWCSGAEILPGDVFSSVAEMFAESKKKTKSVCHQIVERLKQHALVIGNGIDRFGFDHPEFYHFFLGESIGQLLLQGDIPSLRHAFRQSALPQLSMETAARLVARCATELSRTISIANQLFASEPRMSLVKENLSGIVALFLEIAQVKGCTLAGGAFPADALKGRRIADLTFANCYFQRTSLDQSNLDRVHFGRCEFECLDIGSPQSLSAVGMTDCAIHSVVPIGSDVTVFSPTAIRTLLTQRGIALTTTTSADSELEENTDVDQSIRAVERFLKLIIRSPAGINENTIRQRLGTDAPLFLKEVLPRMIELGLIVEVPFSGRGQPQRRLRLGRQLDQITDAIERCSGDFNEFVRLASQSAREGTSSGRSRQ